MTFAIQSVRFPNAFLRMDGSNVNQFEGGGSGTVNCQFYHQGSTPTSNFGNLEVFELVLLGEFIAIQSFSYPNAFLRMDGSNVNQFEGGGGGTVNCQYYPIGSTPQYNSSDYEHFIESLAVLATPSHNNYVSIASTIFGVFLRIDGSNVTRFEGAGSGTVNCQYYPTGVPSSTEDFEVFNIINL